MKKESKLVYKQWWFWVIIVVVLAIIGFATQAANNTDTPNKGDNMATTRKTLARYRL